MASVATSSPPSRGTPPDALQIVKVRWYGHLARAVGFSVPFLAVGLASGALGLLSNQHAHLLAKALLARDTGRLEAIGFLYPPLPFLLAFVFPSSWALVVLDALAAGATAWLLWAGLQRTQFGVWTRVALLLGALATPWVLFLATQQLSDMLVLHLFLVAWYYYLNFVRLRHTWSGFAAGLVLGLAFFAGFYALVAALALAALAPLFSPLEAHSAPAARLAQALVLLFPALWAWFSWSYTAWTFTGGWFQYLRDPAAPVVLLPSSSLGIFEQVVTAARVTAIELLLVPLLLGVFLLLLRYQVRGALALAVLVMTIGLIRAVGFTFSTPLALSTEGVIAIAAASRRIPARWGPVLIALAGLQLMIGLRAAQPNGELRAWAQALATRQAPPAFRAERAFVRQLVADAPPHSILADDRSAYRLIAQAGTARPFLLPAHRRFASALEAPCAEVRAVLVSTVPAPGDVVSRSYPSAPPGFTLRASWEHWRFYTRLPDAPCPVVP